VTERTEEAIFLIDAAFAPHTTSVADGLKTLSHHLEAIGCRPKASGIVEKGGNAATLRGSLQQRPEY
jgi:hypothetical protein